MAMASIGPQIPEHLLRQRQRHINGNSSESEEEVEQKQEAAPSVTIGPQVPTNLTKPSTPSAMPENEDDEEEDYGPALPPDLLAKRRGPSSSTRKAGPSARSYSPPVSTRRVIGPSIPGHDRQSYSDDEEDEGDEYGPMPLPKGVRNTDTVSEGVREFIEREERRKKEVEEAAKPKKLKREEWMLVPPSSSDLLGHLSDPLKLKARQFSRGGSTVSRSAPNNLWTETPAERQQRIADEVAGKKRKAVNADDDGLEDRDIQRKKQRDTEMRKVVEEHNKSSRGRTLLEMHEEGKKKETKNKKDTEEPAVIWDHTRDMSLGGRLMDEKQRGKMISDARSLGDRFGSGKSGGYL